MTITESPVRAAYRPYLLTVRRVTALSPHFVRITLTGEDLENFGTAGLDQRIKLVLPHADGTFSDFGQHEEAGDWYDRWRALPASARNVFRTYTVRRISPEARELDVDIVRHHDAGPAGSWAESACAGDALIVVGPDARSPHHRGGIDWHPGTATRVLLAGDETAAPAICGILENLEPHRAARAFIEVPTAEDVLEVAVAPGARLTWVVRGERPHGRTLIAAVRGWADEERALLSRASAPRRQTLEEIDVDRDLLWDSPEDGEGEFYAWTAGEAGMVKTVRRLLVSERGVDRRRVAFMGYWRSGQSERTE